MHRTAIIDPDTPPARMPQMHGLAIKIKNAVADERYAVSEHVYDRFEERGVTEWQAIDGLAAADVVNVDEQHKPDPEVVFRVLLADGSEADCVWVWNKIERKAIFVTVYFDVRRSI